MPRAGYPGSKRRARMCAALLPFLLALPVCLFAGDVKLERTADTVELSGGQGANTWHIAYGTFEKVSALVASVSPARAYFAHGGWLRLLDTEKGLVIGRWHFSGEIKELRLAGGESVNVIYQEHDPSFPFSNCRFDPSNPKLPQLHLDNLFVERLHQKEATSATRIDLWWVKKDSTPALSQEQARQALTRVEEMIRRDPLSPWFVLVRGRLLEMLNDPRAGEAYRSVLNVPFSDFAEWFRVANILASQNDREVHEAAFQRAYADYIQRDFDPRLFIAAITRLVLFPPRQELGASEERRRDYLERTYQLSPYSEGAAFAWTLYAAEFERSGQEKLAALWGARAEDASHMGTVGFGEFALEFDRWMLLFASGWIAALVYFLVVNRSYKQQHRMDAAAGRTRWSLLGAANVRYWSRQQRLSLFAVAVLCWIAFGCAPLYLLASARLQSMTLCPWAGNLSGAVAQWHFKRLPASPARDLLLAQALLQDGDAVGAERLYRQLPQYPQTWNNLGVLLKNSGREKEAREAFERALQLDPQLHEAALNLGRPPADFWTKQHARFAPGRPMIAPASMAVVRAAYRGPLGRFVADALLGPLNAGRFFSALRTYTWDSAWLTWGRRLLYPLAVATALLLLGSVFLLFVPPTPVTEGADRAQRLLEKALPGTSILWGAAGGTALVCWCLLVTQVALYFALDTPYLFYKTGGMINMQRAFFLDVSQKQAMVLVNPSWPWLYAAPLALLAGNLLLLRRKPSGKARAAGA